MTGAVATVTVKHPTGAVDFKEEDVMSQDTFKMLQAKLEETPASETGETGITLGMTIPTQPYMSVRADVHIRVPCPVGMIEPVYEHCKLWADAKMAEISAEVAEAYGTDK